MKNIINLTKMSLKNLNAIKKFAIISIFAVVVAVFFVSEGTKKMNGAEANSVYLLMIINLMAYIFTYMVMAYEEMSSIDILIGYLPVEKKEYIKSRYLLGLAGVLLGVVLFFVVIFARNMVKIGSIVGSMGMNGILELAGMGIFCAILTISIIIPSHIGFGGTRGRLIAIIGFMAPMFAGAAIANVSDFDSLNTVSFSVALLVGSLILLLGSYELLWLHTKEKESYRNNCCCKFLQ